MSGTPRYDALGALLAEARRRFKELTRDVCEYRKGCFENETNKRDEGGESWHEHALMAKAAKRLKTAPELERMILMEMRRHAVCAGIAAVTVRETSAHGETNWEVGHINALGGHVPPACQNICVAIVARLQQEFELLPEFEWDMDF